MNVKLETKERFHVIKMLAPLASAIMAEELNDSIIKCLESSTKNIIIDMASVEEMEPAFAQNLVSLQEQAIRENRSLVFYHLHKNVIEKLNAWDLTDLLNITPSESEAWDIIHMEEMEREMFGDDEKIDL